MPLSWGRQIGTRQNHNLAEGMVSGIGFRLTRKIVEIQIIEENEQGLAVAENVAAATT